MADSSPNPNNSSFVQSSNAPSSIPTHTLEVGGSSHPGPKQEQDFEVTYNQLQKLQPTTHQFSRALGLLLISSSLPRNPRKKETTCIGVLVSSMEDLVISTLEELADSLEEIVQQGELPPIEEGLEGNEGYFPFSDEEQPRGEELPNYKEDLNGEGEGTLESKSDEEAGEDVVNADLDWMAQGPLCVAN